MMHMCENSEQMTLVGEIRVSHDTYVWTGLDFGQSHVYSGSHQNQ